MVIKEHILNIVLKAISTTFCCLLLTTANTALATDNEEPNFLINNVVIVDGTGTKPFNGAVRIAFGVIADVGELIPGDGETVIDGKGQVLAPGFIDTHSHAD